MVTMVRRLDFAEKNPGQLYQKVQILCSKPGIKQTRIFNVAVPITYIGCYCKS